MAQSTNLAKLLLHVLPPSMQKIRTEMRAAGSDSLTIPQFRIIVNIFRGRNLATEIAKHHGVSMPAMSKMIRGLVQKGLIERVPQSQDRRQMLLKPTPKGSALFLSIRKKAQIQLSKKIKKLDVQEKLDLKKGLMVLERLFIKAVFFLLLCTHVAFAAEPMSWDDCVKEASQKNPELLAAKASLQSSEYQTKVARSGFLPQLSGDATYNYGSIASTFSGNNGSGGFVSSGGGTTDFYSLTANASQNIFAGGGDKARVQQGRANEESAKANLTAIQAKISFDLKSAFSGLLYAQNSVRLAQNIIQRRDANLKLIELRYENGKENKGSLLLSRAYMEQARYDALVARDAIQVAQKQLARVLGRNSSEELTIVGAVPTTEPPEEKEIDALMTTTPDYKTAVAQRKAARAALVIAHSLFYPTVDMNATFGKQKSDFLNNNSGRWSVGATLTVPIFSGGKNYYGSKSANADLRAAVLNQQNVGNTTHTKLEEGYTGFLEGVIKLRADRSFEEAATVRETIARERYNNGLLSFEDWDIIENDLITKQKQLLQSERDRVVAEATWEQTQGKGAF